MKISIEINNKEYSVSAGEILGKDSGEREIALKIMEQHLCRKVGEDLVLGKYTISEDK